MPAQQSHTVWSCYLSGTTGEVPKGTVLCLTLDGTRYIISTADNRAAVNRGSAVLSITPGDDDNPAVEGQYCGVVPNSISGLGDGAAFPVRVSDAGRLERVASPTTDDEVVGHCDADGVAYINFANASAALVTSLQTALNQEATNALTERTTVPLGHYDPRHYGAKFDGTTDDILALEAMMADIPETGGVVHWPPVLCWISRTFIVQKPVKFFGSGGNDARCGGIMIAPGRCAMEMQSVYIASDDGHNGADYGEVHGFNFESNILIGPDTSRGSVSGDRSIVTMNSSHPIIRNGDCRAKPGNTAPNRMFRAATPTTAAVVTDGTPPAWSNTIGAVLVDSYGITWTTESVPLARTDLTSYVVGERVLGLNDNRFLFECTTAGTSNVTPPAEFSSGPYGRGATGCQVGGTITDGSVVWTVHLACGLYVNASHVRLEKIFGYKFTNYVVHAQGGTGGDARALVATDVNNLRGDSITGSCCGGTIYLWGDNCNGWTLHGVDGIDMGAYHPSATLFYKNGGTLPYPDGGRGGHIIFDTSQGGGAVISSYAQLSTGLPVVKTGAGRTAFWACYSELTTEPYFVNGPSWIVGGNLMSVVNYAESSNLQVIDINFGQGISEVDRRFDTDLHVSLLAEDGETVYLRNRLNDSSQGGLGSRYNDGFWTERYHTVGPSAVNIDQEAYEVATAPAGLDPGPGLLGFPKGFTLGRSGTDSGAVFRGHIGARKSNMLRSGARKAGDEFTDGTTTYVETSDGYRGIPWEIGDGSTVDTRSANATIGRRPHVVEPTTNTDSWWGFEKVFACTTTGWRNHTTEPDWTTAVAPGDTVAEVGGAGGAVWTLVGFTPTYAVRDAQRNEFSCPSDTVLGRPISAWATGPTSDDTPTVLLPVSLPRDIYGDGMIVAHAEVVLCFVDTFVQVGGSLAVKSKLKRVAGVLTWVADSDLSDPALIDGTATGGITWVAVDDDTIGLQVTGIAAQGIKWQVSAHIQFVNG